MSNLGKYVAGGIAFALITFPAFGLAFYNYLAWLGATPGKPGIEISTLFATLGWFSLVFVVTAELSERSERKANVSQDT